MVRCFAISLGLLLVTSGWASITRAESVFLSKEENDTKCTVYEGSSYGNTTSSIRLRLCGTSEVHGQAAMSSRSGDRVHHVEGTWRGDSLTLTDVRLEQKPQNPRHRFCWVELWSLKRTGDKLEGYFDSKKCRDRARLVLKRVK